MGREASKETKEYSEVKYILKMSTVLTPRFILFVLLKAKHKAFASF